MPSSARRRIVSGLLAVLLSLGAATALAYPQSTPAPAAAQQPLRLTDAEFWRLSSQMSEPGGFFRSDNFTSNENGFPAIVNHLRATKAPGGVYMGVGPEQNFHYMVALRPKMAFLLDIRRQAVMQHLMYKALFELSSDRNEFIARLFSMPRHVGIDTSSSIDAIWSVYYSTPGDPAEWTRNLAAVLTHLTKTRGIPLDSADIGSLTYVYEAFYRLGATISYGGYGRSGGGGGRGGSGTNFSSLTRLTDPNGVHRSFLATEETFRFLKDMHMRNVIIPVVGNFGGPKAIRAVGEYVKAQGERVTAMYVSNVEQYLFQDGLADAFYANVATLPLDSESVFIRPGGGGFAGGYTVITGFPVTGGTSGLAVTAGTTVTRPLPGDSSAVRRGDVCPMMTFLRAVSEGRVRSRNDATACPG